MRVWGVSWPKRRRGSVRAAAETARAEVAERDAARERLLELAARDDVSEWHSSAGVYPTVTPRCGGAGGKARRHRGRP